MTPRHYEHIYIFTIMWAVGTYFELDDRAKLEEFMRKSEDVSLDLPDTSEVQDSTMFDYYVDEKGQSTYHLKINQFHVFVMISIQLGIFAVMCYKSALMDIAQSFLHALLNTIYCIRFHGNVILCFR